MFLFDPSSLIIIIHLIQVEPRVVNLTADNQLSTEVKVNYTLPLGCDCCQYWINLADTKLFLEIITNTSHIATGLLDARYCQYELSRSIEELTIPIVAELRTGTATGTKSFMFHFEPIHILMDHHRPRINIWQGYTPSSVQVFVISMKI